MPSGSQQDRGQLLIGIKDLISNRQGGRRRGRGGQRGQTIGGQPGGGRQDNRQRGNAAQLLEKYKSMARDSQLAGDRVQMEYYLQFAEHYFRILNENRARFEEQRRQRGDEGDESEEEDVEASGEQEGVDESAQEDERPQRQERDRGDRSRRFARDERRDSRREGNGADRTYVADERLPLEALPPAIGRDEEQAEVADEEAPRPRRRARRPRPEEGESEIAPAA
jgi:uncharacterized protein DUF4167